MQREYDDQQAIDKKFQKNEERRRVAIQREEELRRQADYDRRQNYQAWYAAEQHQKFRTKDLLQ